MLPNERLPDREEKFAVIDRVLTQTVTSSNGKGYIHHCDLETLEAIAHAIAEVGPEGLTLTAIAKQEGLKFTRAHVALEFLKERGLIDIRHRRSYPATSDTYLDAMIEFHALAHEGECHVPIHETTQL